MVSTTGRALPLLGAVLRADAAGGVARVALEQRFRNVHAEPLAVTYSLPLPWDGAVSGFAFRIGQRRVVGEIDRRPAARERYEQALVDGRSAALLEQDRSSLFTQEIGNIPPGEEVVVEVTVDQRLRWLDEGAWEWRFPTVVGPRYLGEPGRIADASRVTQDVAEGSLAARVALSLTLRDVLAAGRAPESPSHAVDTLRDGAALRVQLGDAAGARLDRDVVVRWRVATPAVGLALDTGRAGFAEAHGLLTIVPPQLDGGRQAVPRDLIVLLDTSGSMQGEPLAQAVRVTSALVDTLRAGDQLELIEFSSNARRWKRAPVAATEAVRRDAIAWLSKLRASGSTEMRTGILEAMASLRPGAQRQIVLVTDGAIGFESQVVAAICDKLPASSRLHTVGVGSGVNRSLTGPAARAGHGVEVIIGLGEDPERAAARIVARTTAPLVVDLALGGSALLDHAPTKLPDLFAGAPALISVALRATGGELVVRGRTSEGAWEQRLAVDAVPPREGNRAVVALFGREAVEDLETRLAAGGDAREIDARIERLGVDFQIATRLTSWVAVSEDRTVDPADPVRRERMPHELPYGVSAEGLGLRTPSGGPALAGAAFGAPMSASIGAPAAFRARMAVPAGGLPPGLGGSAKVDLEARLGKTQAAAPLGAPPPAASAPSRAGSTGAPPPAPPPPPVIAAPSVAPKSRSLLGAIRDFFGGRDDDAGGPSDAAPLPAAPATTKGGGGRTLRGRIALLREGEIVIEVFADAAALEWVLSGEAQVTLADGRVVTATVDLARTTKAGTIAQGAAARLALVLPAGAAQGVASITVEISGEAVIITV
jgi:Ca-activated chloride channel family protein